MIPTLMAVLMLIITLFMPFVIVAYPIAKSGCRETCGGIQIPYPFGIGPNCSRPGFEVSCKMLNNSSIAPFLPNDIPILDISNSGYLDPLLLVNKSIHHVCYNERTNSDHWNLSGTPYQIHVQNLFIVIGCDINANISFGNDTNMFDNRWITCTTTGCYNSDSIIGGACSGRGCCLLDIPDWVSSLSYYEVSIQPRDYNSSLKYNTSQCAYVLLTDDLFYFQDITTDKLYTEQMPVLLEWRIGHEGCEKAQANKSSYACNSYSCQDSFDGYVCFCSDYYDGNPYLDGGCGGLSLSL